MSRSYKTILLLWLATGAVRFGIALENGPDQSRCLFRR
jgi:hypothetical protein